MPDGHRGAEADPYGGLKVDEIWAEYKKPEKISYSDISAIW